MGVVKCYCLVGKNNLPHCPLATNPKELETTFNHFVRGEEIIQVDIDDRFVCEEERKAMCESCPFK